MIGNNGHSWLGASGMHRWSECLGQPNLAKTLPPEAFKSSSAAEEGTDAHDYAAACMKGGSWPSLLDIGVERRRDDRVYTPDKQMVDLIGDYTHYCLDDLMGEDQYGIEELFDLSELHEGCYGTGDFWRYRPSAGVLRIVDLKWGAGKYVSPAGNLQLKYYGLGVLLKLNLKSVKKISLEIYQPRIEWKDKPGEACEINAVDLYDFAADLAELAAATMPADAPLKAGDWCHWCPAIMICPEQKSKAKRASDLALKPVGLPAAGGVVNMDDLVWTLRNEATLKALLTAANETAYTMMMQGVAIPGFKIVEKLGRRAYTASPAEVIERLRELGAKDVDIFDEPELRSPAQLEKRKAIGKEVVATLCEKKSSGYAVVPDTDKRPAAVLSNAVDALKPVLSLEQQVSDPPAFLRRGGTTIASSS